MIKCQNCFHWRKIRDSDYKTDIGDTWEGPHGECMLIWDCSIDERAWVSMSLPHTHSNLLQMCEASLITKPDFGCVLGKEK